MIGRLRKRFRREPTAAMRDDAGVIAIIVALSISTFLLGFAALAVDLGMAYERQSVLQSTAERLALAGAQDLPSIQEAVTGVRDALKTMCTDQTDIKNTPGVCPNNPADPNAFNWMRDGQPGNGEVTFYQDTGQTSLFSTGANGQPAPIGNGFTQAEGIKVSLPPSKVTFGFAGAFTNGSTDVTKSATARIGTPLGAGILPFALTQADIEAGQWCVKTNAAAGGGTPLPKPTQGFLGVLLTPIYSNVQSNTSGQHVSMQLNFGFGFGVALNSFKFYAQNATGPLNVTLKNGQFSVEVPVGTPGSQAAVWAVGKNFGATVTTSLAYFDYSGTVPTTTDPCTLPQAQRGFSQLARTTDDGGSTDLTSNIRVGPQVREYAAGGLAGTLGPALNCVSTLFSPATTCLSNVTGSTFASSMTTGLFSSGTGNSPGRLDHSCVGAGTQGSGPNGADADASQLLSNSQTPATSLVDTSQTSPSLLLGRILSHQSAPPGQQGWITSKALRCGRLAVMPVVNPVTINGIAGGQSIMSFTYVWIDDIGSNGQPTGNRGVNWSGNQVSSVQGYVIDPGYLPAQVAGSLQVGPYLGANMPKEALLVHDLGAPDA